MASRVLFPPSIVGNQKPWIIGKTTCKVYFSLSKFNIYDKDSDNGYKYLNKYYTPTTSTSNILEKTKILENLYAHIYVYDITDKSKAIKNVDQKYSATIKDYETNIMRDNSDFPIYPTNSLGDETENIYENLHLRQTRVILNASIHQVKDDTNLFYVYLYDEDIHTGTDFSSEEDSFKEGAFEPGHTYQVQIRLTESLCTGTSISVQDEWLQTHSSEFSEWSTISILRPLEKVETLFSSFSECPVVKEGSQAESYSHNTPIENYLACIRGSIVVDSSYADLQDLFGGVTSSSTACQAEDYHTALYDLSCNGAPTYAQELRLSPSYTPSNFFGVNATYSCGDADSEALSFYKADLYLLEDNITPADDIANEYANGTLLESSGTQYPSYGSNLASRTMYYEFNTELENSVIASTEEEDLTNVTYSVSLDDIKYYKVKLYYETTHGFNQTLYLYFVCAFMDVPNGLSVQIDSTFETTYLPREEGYIPVLLNSGISASNGYVLKRADSTTGFSRWDTIKKYINNDEPFSLSSEVYYDKLVESGVWYKYGLQIIKDTNTNYYSSLVKMADDDTVMADFDHAYLVGQDGQQLKIKFNPTVSSLTINMNDSVQTTLGSKYPYTNRTGNTKYKSFSLGGLISFLVDENNFFLPSINIDTSQYCEYPAGHDLSNDDEFIRLCALYQNQQLAYYHFKKNFDERISIFEDFAWEKEFRRQVLEFLTDGKPKVFKSPSEGLMIVKLSGITLNPETQLGRLLYSFTATATEIDVAEPNTLQKYKIANNPEETVSNKSYGILGNTSASTSYAIGFGDYILKVSEGV